MTRRLIRYAAALALTVSAAIATATAGESVRPVAAGDPLPTALIELDGSGSENPDGGQLIYEWTQIYGPKVELSDPGAVKPYFRTGKPGLYRFQLVVTANGLKSDPFLVEIMIERDNQPPVAKAPSDVRGEVDKILDIDGSESFDPEGEELTYRWRLLTPGLEIPAGILHQPKLSFVPKQDGIFELELVVSDGENASKPAVVRLAIKPKPRPPVAKAKAIPREIPAAPVSEFAMAAPTSPKPMARIEAPAVARVGEKITLDARASRGSSGNRLEYLWRQKSGPFVTDFELVFDGAAERFVPPRAGDYEFELIVSDGALDSDPIIQRVKVVKDVDPPVAVVTAPSKAQPGAVVKLDATQSYDLEGSALTYRWRQTGGPRVNNYLIDEKLGDSAPAFQPQAAGLYSFELVVSNGRMSSKPVEIEVQVGDAVKRPVSLVVAGPEVARTGDRLVLTVRAENAEGRKLDFVWRQVEGPATVLPATNGPRATVSPTAPGRYIFDLTALENGAVAATVRRTLEVFNQGQDPAATSATPPTTVESLRPSPAVTPPTLSPPVLTPLMDMPSVPPLSVAVPGTGASSGVGAVTPGRPAAQIYPSVLGESRGETTLVERVLPPPVLPMGTK